jgi:hypothetical protein
MLPWTHGTQLGRQAPPALSSRRKSASAALPQVKLKTAIYRSGNPLQKKVASFRLTPKGKPVGVIAPC